MYQLLPNLMAVGMILTKVGWQLLTQRLGSLFYALKPSEHLTINLDNNLASKNESFAFRKKHRTVY